MRLGRAIGELGDLDLGPREHGGGGRDRARSCVELLELGHELFHPFRRALGRPGPGLVVREGHGGWQGGAGGGGAVLSVVRGLLLVTGV